MAERVSVECPSCSARLGLADASKLGKKLRCPKCSEVFVAESADEPEESGRRSSSSSPRASSKSASKKGKSSKGRSQSGSPALLIGGGVALLLLVAGAGAWMFMGGGEAVPNPAGAGAAPVGANNPAVAGASAPAVASATPAASSPGEPPAVVPLKAQTVAGVELEPKSAFSGRVRLLIPKSFEEMKEIKGEGNKGVRSHCFMRPDPFFSFGYDPQTKRFAGTFVASVMTRLWVYDGSLDATEKVLTLDTEGPKFTGEGLAKYQDIIEFISSDHRTLSSQILGDDGQWQPFMKGHYQRRR